MNELSGLTKICAVAAVGLFVACSFGCDGSGTRKATESRDSDWSPEGVTVQCSAQDKCPSHQGLLFGYWHNYGSITLERCTASLYDSTHIITAGHCKMDEAEAVYFLPVPKPGLNNHMIAVKFVDGENQDGLDYASYELGEPVYGREYVSPARVAPVGPIDLVALVINKINFDSYILEPLECTYSANSQENYPYDQNPKKFYIPSCLVLGGNSGGGIFRRGDLNTMYGLVATGTDDATSEYERLDRIRKFGAVNFVGATNVRCIQLPGWPQVEPNCR